MTIPAFSQGVPTQRGTLATGVGLPDDPPQILRSACAALVSGLVKGRHVSPLSDGECGAASPIELESVAGVDLPSRPLTNCAMATGFAAFLQELKARGLELGEVTTGPGYECRIRNRAETGKISEHGFANALDISELVLADGRRIVVDAAWPHLAEAGLALSTEEKKAGREARTSTDEARIVTRIAATACGYFTTVLTPDSNAAHHGHIHLDLGCHGRDCSYMICE